VQKFNDATIRDKIRNEGSPMIAASLGRDRTQKFRRDWETKV